MGKLEYQSGADHWTQTRSIWDRLLGTDRRKIWLALAREIGGEYSERGLLGSPKIVVPLGSLQARIDRMRLGARDHQWYLRCRVRYRDVDGFRFRGPDPVYSNQPERVVRLFSEAAAALGTARITSRMFVAVRDINWWFGWEPGSAELYLRFDADARSIDELRALFRTTKALLDCLRAGGSVAV